MRAYTHYAIVQLAVLWSPRASFLPHRYHYCHYLPQSSPKGRIKFVRYSQFNVTRLTPILACTTLATARRSVCRTVAVILLDTKLVIALLR